MYVTRYKVTRHYGGPEEGGWYYDRHEADEKVFMGSEEAAKEERDRLNKQAQAEHQQPNGIYQGRFSVAGHTDIEYSIESEFGEHDDHDHPRPRYE